MSDASVAFADLLARARQGDAGALAELARTYEPNVRLVARYRLGAALRPYLDSMDLVQSVHRSLLLGLRNDRFDLSGPDKLVALALTIVRRKAAKHWRRLRRQKRLSHAGPTDADDPVQLLTALSSPGNDPAKAAQVRDAVQHLWKHLDSAERRVLELRLNGLSTADVARELSQDPDVLRVRLSRLRKRLRDAGVLTEWL